MQKQKIIFIVSAIIILIVLIIGGVWFSHNYANEKNNNDIAYYASELVPQGELVRERDNGYKNICVNGHINNDINNFGISNIVNKILSEGVSLNEIKCTSSDEQYAISVLLLGGKHWCSCAPGWESCEVKYCSNGDDHWDVAPGMNGLHSI